MHEIEYLHHVVLPQSQQRVPSLLRIRVPGGWLYSTYDFTEQNGTLVLTKTTAFVPYSSEDEDAR